MNNAEETLQGIITNKQIMVRVKIEMLAFFIEEQQKAMSKIDYNVVGTMLDYAATSDIYQKEIKEAEEKVRMAIDEVNLLIALRDGGTK